MTKLDNGAEDNFIRHDVFLHLNLPMVESKPFYLDRCRRRDISQKRWYDHQVLQRKSKMFEDMGEEIFCRGETAV
jgi:hypothetical protein